MTLELIANRDFGRRERLGWGSLLVLAAATGCATSSHKSVRTYDYSEEPPRGRQASQPTETERVEDAGDWQMAAPGEMVVDPKRDR